MKHRSGVLVAVFVAVGVLVSSQSTAAVYQCQHTDSVVWNGATIDPNPWKKWDRKLKFGFEFDDLTGSFVRTAELVRDGGSFEFDIVQRPSQSMDLVAIQKTVDYEKITLRIRSWDKEQGIVFLLIQNWEMTAGKCVIRPY